MNRFERMALVSHRLRQALRDSELSYRKLAVKSGIPRRSIEEYAAGAMPTAPALSALCEALEVNADWILGLKEDT